VTQLRFLRVGERADLLKNFHRFLGLLHALDAVANDEGKLRDRLDAVAAGLDQGRDRGGGDGRDHGVALLLNVDLAVPAAPDLGGREHTTAAAHVAEGGLASAVRTAAGDTRNTRNGAARAPGLGGGLVTGAPADGVWLAAVARNVGVDEIDNVGANGSLHDIRKRDGGGCIAL